MYIFLCISALDRSCHKNHSCACQVRINVLRTPLTRPPQDFPRRLAVCSFCTSLCFLFLFSSFLPLLAFTFAFSFTNPTKLLRCQPILLADPAGLGRSHTSVLSSSYFLSLSSSSYCFLFSTTAAPLLTIDRCVVSPSCSCFFCSSYFPYFPYFCFIFSNHIYIRFLLSHLPSLVDRSHRTQQIPPFVYGATSSIHTFFTHTYSHSMAI